MPYISRVSTGATLALVALGAAMIPRIAGAEWPVFGRAVTTAPNSQTHPEVATDGTNGVIVVWQDQRSARVNVFARHLQGSGEPDPAWPADGRALLTDSLALAGADGGQFLPRIASDGAGGAIVVWEDGRSAATELDLFAQHVLASGVVDPAWPPNGIAVVAAAGPQEDPVLVPDGAGGAIVAWMDARPGATVADLYAQHVLASGQVDPRWPVNGRAVSTAPGAQQAPAIVEDGAGGAIIAWFDDRGTATGFDVYAQHVLGSGAVDPAWPVNGRAVCSASGDQGLPTIASDGAHGALLAWSDSRVVGTSHIFAGRVLASGALDPAWPVNGRGISNAGVLDTRPLAVPDGAGGAIVNFQSFTVHLNMYAQHVTAAGIVDPAWPPAGRPLSLTNRQQDHAAIVSDGAGGAVVAWEDSFDVVAQHVLASGALDAAYPDTGRVLVGLPSQQGDPAIVGTAGSGAIVVWTDGRAPASAPDIFALQVLAAGPAGVPAPAPPHVALRAGPNPATGSVWLRFELSRRTAVRLSIYDLAGRRVRDLVSDVRAPGAYAIRWDLRDERGRAAGPGLYVVRLEAEGRRWTEKLVTLR